MLSKCLNPSCGYITDNNEDDSFVVKSGSRLSNNKDQDTEKDKCPKCGSKTELITLL